MFRFALRNMAVKKAQFILIFLSVLVSASIVLISFNVSNQVNDGITNTAGYYSVIIGKSGSETQLAMNTMYFTDKPIGTIPYEISYGLQSDTRVNECIPVSIADNYRGYTVVGTETGFLKGKTLKEGRMFDDTSHFEAVVGSEVAKMCKLGIGSELHLSHSEEGHEHEHKESIVVVGILETTHTVYDKTVFTESDTVWDMHGHHDHDEEEHEEHEEHDHEHEDELMVCAFCIRTKTPADAMKICNEYNGKTVDGITLQAIEPMSVVRDVLNDTDNTKYIVYVLCGVILVMNLLVITVVTILNMFFSRKEIETMRLIGISRHKINLLYLIENGLTGLCSCFGAFLFGHIGLSVMSGYVADMGVVLDNWKVYPFEIVLLGVILLISIVPTIIYTQKEMKQ